MQESNILRRNQSQSTGNLAREPRPFSTSYRPYEERFKSSSENVLLEKRGSTDESVVRRPTHERTQRPVSNFYEYQRRDDAKPGLGDIRNWESIEEPMEITPDTTENHQANPEEDWHGPRSQVAYDHPAPPPSEAPSRRIGSTAMFTKQRYGNIDMDFEDPIRYRTSDEEQIQPKSSFITESEPGMDARNLSYRDFVQPPPRESREGFVLGKQTLVSAIEKNPRRQEMSGMESPGEEERKSFGSGSLSYRDYAPVPKGGRRKEVFLHELKKEKQQEEMPWRQEVRELRDKSPREEQAPSDRVGQSNVHEDGTILSYQAVNPVSQTGSLKRDAFLREAKREKGVEEMPWRKEVKELKERPSKEEEVQLTPEPAYESPDGRDVRKMKYRDFALAPQRSLKRDTFVLQDERNKEREEMPWRQEIRDLKERSPREEEVKPSTERVTESAYEDETTLSYRDFVPVQHTSLKRDGFLREAARQKDVEEMPWRQEIKELKSSSLAKEDESEDVSSPNSMEYTPDPNVRKLSYRDFTRPPPSKPRHTFITESQKTKEEMPWRTEVQELRNRGPREEDIQDEDSEKRRSRRKPDEPRNKPSYSSRSESSPALDGRMLSYQDFVCPPSKINREPSPRHAGKLQQAKRDVPRGRYKVQDLTKKFTEIEAEQLRPKEGGRPSRKSLVDRDELERIERELKTRTWHGFPPEYADSVDRRSSHPDNDVAEGFRYRPADISADNYNDVFEDPEALFVKHESHSPPAELQKQPDDHTKFEYEDEHPVNYYPKPRSQEASHVQTRQVDPYGQAWDIKAKNDQAPEHSRIPEREGGQYNSENNKMDYSRDDQIPINRVSVQSRGYPSWHPQYNPEEEKLSHRREADLQWNRVNRNQRRPDQDMIQPKCKAILREFVFVNLFYLFLLHVLIHIPVNALLRLLVCSVLADRFIILIFAVIVIVGARTVQIIAVTTKQWQLKV